MNAETIERPPIFDVLDDPRYGPRLWKACGSDEQIMVAKARVLRARLATNYGAGCTLDKVPGDWKSGHDSHETVKAYEALAREFEEVDRPENAYAIKYLLDLALDIMARQVVGDDQLCEIDTWLCMTLVRIARDSAYDIGDTEYGRVIQKIGKELGHVK